MALNKDLPPNLNRETPEIDRLARELDKCWQAYQRVKEAADVISFREGVHPALVESMKKAANQQFTDEVYDAVHRFSSGEEAEPSPKLEAAEAETSSEAETEAMPNIRKLYRVKDDKMVAGICGGLAKYFEIDSSIIRVGFVLASIFWGAGIIAYVVLLLILQHEE
ncbi:MAG: PspC domain-containing protein [Candidatus Omnitrophota bacterium]